MFVFFTNTATTEIYTLSLHDALPICLAAGDQALADVRVREDRRGLREGRVAARMVLVPVGVEDRKSTRLNSSHANISYAVFCLKKKKKQLYVPVVRQQQLMSIIALLD